jgi:hypothetical protein
MPPERLLSPVLRSLKEPEPCTQRGYAAMGWRVAAQDFGSGRADGCCAARCAHGRRPQFRLGLALTVERMFAQMLDEMTDD